MGATPVIEVDTGALAKIEAATKGLKPHADPAGIGIKLLAKMGYGIKGTGLGREGQVAFPFVPRPCCFPKHTVLRSTPPPPAPLSCFRFVSRIFLYQEREVGGNRGCYLARRRGSHEVRWGSEE
jgi:hypothetical protein